jgi:hypothetical protein
MFYSRDSNIKGLGNLINRFKPASEFTGVFYLIVLSPSISRYKRLIIVFFWARVSLKPLIIVVASSIISTISLYVVTSRLCCSLA